MSSPAIIFSEKPYDVCIECAHIGVKCDGPNFLAMSMPRLSEWCRLRKEYLHRKDPKWTNAYIAEQAGISKVSVDRFLSGHIEDIKTSTIAKIIQVLIDGTWGQYPCAMAPTEAEVVYVDSPALVEKAEKAAARCAQLQAKLNAMEAEHKDEIKELRATNQRATSYLMEQIKFREEQMISKDKLIQESYAFLKRKDRAILVLTLLLAVALLIIVGALIIDRLNPDAGFFWRLASKI